MSDTEPGSRTDAAARAFSVCWAVATFFHLAMSDTPTLSTPATVGVLLAAAALLVTRGAPLAWLALAFTGLADFWRRLPSVTGSEFMTATVYVLVLLAFAAVIARTRSWPITARALYDELRPALAALLVFMLAWAVLFKLNSAFFDLEVSSAPGFYDDICAILGIEPLPWVRGMTPWITLLVEIAITVGLLLQRARGLAVVALWALWLLIGVVGVVTFSSKLYALSLLFLDRRLVSHATEQVRARLGGSRASRAGSLSLLLAVMVTLALTRPAPIFVVLVFVVLALAFFYALGAARWRERIAFGSPALARPAPWVLAVLVGATVNEAGPFLRLKDWPTYRLYCDLYTYSCETNHLLLDVVDDEIDEPIVTTDETWRVLWSKLHAGRHTWEYPAYWSSLRPWQGRWVWDASSFAESVAMLARKNELPPDEVPLHYLRDGVAVRETLADLLGRDDHRSWRRFFPLFPEPVGACSETTPS